jgi:hypothetical protein
MDGTERSMDDRDGANRSSRREPTTGPLCAVVGPSVYRRPVRRSGVRQAAWSIAGHLGLWLVCAAWLLGATLRDHDDTAVKAAMLFSSIWLPLGPTLVVSWERRLDHTESRLRSEGHVDAESWETTARALRRIGRAKYVFIAVPLLLMVVAYVAGDEFVGDTLGLPRSGLPYVLGLVVLAVGGLAAGWGVWAAVVTMRLGWILGSSQGDFAPYAGTTSRSAGTIGGFCFASAVVFGIGGAVLTPGLVAAALAAEAATAVALWASIGIIVVTTASLLIVPAVRLSRQSDDGRVEYLDRLSAQIDQLANVASDPCASLSHEQYMRLRALLEMRDHVVRHTVPTPSLEMVKRIPVAVLAPVSSVLVSWLSLIA